MRAQRLKSEMSRANKELQHYQEKAELSSKLQKIEERRAKSLGKVMANDKDDQDDQDEVEVEEMDRIKVKRMKNIEKMMKYHGRKRRDFKQREPLPTELEPEAKRAKLD